MTVEIAAYIGLLIPMIGLGVWFSILDDKVRRLRNALDVEKFKTDVLASVINANSADIQKLMDAACVATRTKLEDMAKGAEHVE